MRKIAYCLNWDSQWGSGILNKVLTHVRTWGALGYEAKIFMLARYDDAHAPSSFTDSSVPLVTRRSRNIADRFVQYYPLTRLIALWNPDVIYLRYEGAYPALVSLARQIPMVLEINTDDVSEYRLGPTYRDWYNRLTRSSLLAEARGMVFMTDELSRKAHFTRFKKPSVVISNGVDLSSYHQLPAPNNSNPRLIFMAGSSHEAWQGLDKICVLAEHCPTWEFDLIGITPAQLQGSVPPNMRLHGFLPRAGYEPIFARADVALGTLALHRKQMEEASPLKVREYLAFGLPTIIAYTDSDFPQPNPYILQLPNTPDNISSHLSTIRRFVEDMLGKRISRGHVSRLDVQQKERKRLEFFRSVLEQTNR